MRDWFEWNGVPCTAFGIHVSEQPAITIPKERSTDVTIPGRSGTLTQVEGDGIYDVVSLSVSCFVKDMARINEINAWLKGSGTVRFANRPEGYYEARIANQIPFDKIIRGNPYRSFTVTFKCNPYFHLIGDSIIELTSSGSTIRNVHGFASYPLITIHGSGDVTLKIGDISVSANGVDGEITIDTEAMLAYKVSGDSDAINQSSKVTLDDEEWPMLEPGENTITWTGSITKVEFEPRWRCI